MQGCSRRIMEARSFLKMFKRQRYRKKRSQRKGKHKNIHRRERYKRFWNGSERQFSYI